MSEEDVLRRKLSELKTEHRDLDDVIDRLAHQFPFDQLKLQRMKKRKLVLRDQISKLAITPAEGVAYFTDTNMQSVKTMAQIALASKSIDTSNTI